MENHEVFMKRCLELALKGAGQVAPNPMVGSVLVREGKIIAEGWHRQYGGPHAEVDAIHHVGDERLLKESTLYVNLEPCSHHGKTPPCSDLIISKGIPSVVIACVDPNPLVQGKGIEKLIRSGIDVRVGILEKEALFLNRRFITYITKQRPYIILKWAQSSDGFIDHVRSDEQPGPAGISCDDSRKLSHLWRSEEAAIMVGTNTVLADDPQLTVRHVSGRNPVRITFDRKERIPNTAQILDGTAPTIVFTAEKNYITEFAEYIRIDFDKDPLGEAMEILHERKIQSVIVEGGTAILQQFIKRDLWDEARIFVSPSPLNEGIAAPTFPFTPSEEINSGTDRLNIYYR